MANTTENIILTFKTQIDDTGFKKDAKKLKTDIDKVNSSDEATVNIKTTIDTSPLQKLKSDLKEATAEALKFEEGSEGFIKASQRAGKLRDELKDVQSSIKQFSGSPIENLSNSFRGLKDSIMNLDLGGIKSNFNGLKTSLGGVGKSMLGIGKGTSVASKAMKGFGAALAATGIGAIVIAVTLLITHFDELKESGGLVGKVLTKIGDTVQSVVKWFKKLSDQLGLTDFAGKEQAENQAKYQEALAETLDKIEKEKQEKAKIAKEKADKAHEAYLKQVEQVISAQKKIRESDKNRYELAQHYRELDEKKRLEELNKLRNEALQRKADALQAEEDLQAELKRRKDRRAEEAKKAEEIETQVFEAKRKAQADREEAELQSFNELQEKKKNKALEIFDTISTISGQIGDILNTISDRNIQKTEEEKNAKLEALEKQKNAGIITDQQYQKAKNKIMLDAFKVEQDLKRKQFKQEKAIRVVEAIMGTAAGIVKAIPNIPKMILAAATGAIQIGLIAAQKFPEGEAPSASISTPSPTEPSVAGGPGVNGVPSEFSAPQFFGLGGRQTSTLNQQQYQKVYVLESDISQTQRKVNVLESRSIIG